jgi:glycosyltransferase involved in cell wall biosynthesis
MTDNLVSIIIPSRNEKYLNRTIIDILKKAEGSVEIIAVLDGYDTERIAGVTYVHHPEVVGMKNGINSAAKVATGQYIMKLDAHCIVAPSFDRRLIADHQPNWIQIPRRHPILEDEWLPNFESQINYEYWVFPLKYSNTSLHGFRWITRQFERKDIMIDDTLTFQGSGWFMARTWWNQCDFMNDEGYNELHAQEAAYLGTTTWLRGGRVVVNKNTWYAHLFKSKQAGRGYHMDERKRRMCYEYSYRHWVHDNKDGFIQLIEKFWPLPGWPDNWKQLLYSPPHGNSLS